MLVLFLAGCGALELDPVVPYAFVVYDPGAGEIPTPNDLARDAEEGHLALPIDEGMSEAERALRASLNRTDAWSTISELSLRLSAPVDPATVTSETVAVWEWALPPRPVEGLVREVSEDGTRLSIAPPGGGWAPGGRYVAVVRGLATRDGAPLDADAAFVYLRSPEPLIGHDRAFPGADRSEREAVAEALEPTRRELAPYFEHFEAQGAPRDEIDALWTFSITRRPELAMDAASQRMPLPFDLLVDPATGLVSLPPSPEDDPLEADAKLVANTLDGFSLSADLAFEATDALDPATVSEETVELWDLSATPVRVPASVAVWRDEGPCGPGDDGCTHVVVDPQPLPLSPGTRYAVLVREGITDRFGAPLAPMAIGHLLALDAPVSVDGASRIGAVPDADAARVEPLRLAVDLLLDSVGRQGVITAWPFTTMDRVEPLTATINLAALNGTDPNPIVTDRGPPNRLFGEDPLSDLFPGLLNPADVIYLPRLDGVAEVVEGTIRSPVHLDPVTRRWREPPVIDEISFVATIPEGVPVDVPVPVVIFGHAVVTDRRFLLTIAGALAQRGMMAVSIDFPYHGKRIACVDSSLAAVPNFFPPALQPLLSPLLPQVDFSQPLLYVAPCASGTASSCSPDGRCLGPDGQPEPFSAFPIVDVRPASGAAFLDVQDLPHIPDHFRQALVDLGALRHSLQNGNWSTVLGRNIRTDRFLYVGQSLGAIIGADFVALEPTIARAVLNVPGADMVDMFDDSTFFGPQMAQFVDDLGVAEGSYEHERLLNVARWLVDSVDPHTVGHLYREQPERVAALIQMDRIDASRGDLVIPNHTTDVLAEVSGLPVAEYPSVLHGDLVIPLLGDQMLEDLADFLAGGAL